MTLNSRKTLTSMIAGFALYAAYIGYALGSKAPEPDNLQSWARVMLVFIGIGVVAAIIIQILFFIISAVRIAANDRDYQGKKINNIISSSMVEDERDKLIGLKSAHIGYTIAGLGFVAALAALALGMRTLYALHILFGFSGAASLTEGILSIYYYEKGICGG